MVARILDPYLQERLIAERQASGADRYDEVWDGVYVMSPLANNEHQLLASRLAAIFHEALGNKPDIWCMAGANVSDQETAWTHNYRCPDVVVVLPGSKAVDRDTHWFGGPDFLVEIASEGDASREKLAFYGDIGVREAMIVDRDPWSLVLYRLDSAGRMATVGSVSLSSSGSVASAVLGVEMKLVLRDSRPSIEIQHLTTGRIWRT